jgi:hypothetical protein
VAQASRLRITAASRRQFSRPVFLTRIPQILSLQFQIWIVHIRPTIHQSILMRTGKIGRLLVNSATTTHARLADHLATVLAARYVALINKWDGEESEKFTRKLRALRPLCRDITLKV